jgi:hypothetical protein
MKTENYIKSEIATHKTIAKNMSEPFESDLRNEMQKSNVRYQQRKIKFLESCLPMFGEVRKFGAFNERNSIQYLNYLRHVRQKTKRDIRPIELKIKCMEFILSGEPIHKFFKRIKEEI